LNQQARDDHAPTHVGGYHDDEICRLERRPLNGQFDATLARSGRRETPNRAGGRVAFAWLNPRRSGLGLA
jgi:hypothetical protein